MRGSFWRKNWWGLVVIGVVGMGLVYSVGLVERGTQWLSHAFYRRAAIVVEVDKRRPLRRIWEGMAQGFEQKEMSLAAAEGFLRSAKVRYVRLDHILDGYGVVQRGDDGRLKFDFGRLDRLVGEIVAVGAKPYFSLSYMPPAISRGDVVDKPRVWGEWEQVVAAVVAHYSRDFMGGLEGVIYEVWNEPDLFGGWRTYGSKNYLELYMTAARAAERVNGAKPFLFGGPATTGFYPAWMKDFYRKLSWVRKDFVSWHRYSYRVDDFLKDVKEMKRVVRPLITKQQKVFISEWGPDSERGKVYDSNLAGAHLVAVVREMLETPVDMMLAFEVMDGKGGQKWHGGWGMVTNPEYGEVALKPRGKVYQMLARLGEERLGLTGEGSFVKAIASRRKTGEVVTVITNYDSRGRHEELFPVVWVGLKDGRYMVVERYLSGRVVRVPVEVKGGRLRREYAVGPNEVVMVEVVRVGQ